MSDKKKKKKVVYYDDGRTIADMSGLYGAPSGDDDASSGRNSQGRCGDTSSRRPGKSLKEQAATYWNTVKTMFLPMLATLGIIGGAYLILWILLEIVSLLQR